MTVHESSSGATPRALARHPQLPDQRRNPSTQIQQGTTRRSEWRAGEYACLLRGACQQLDADSDAGAVGLEPQWPSRLVSLPPNSCTAPRDKLWVHKVYRAEGGECPYKGEECPYNTEECPYNTARFTNNSARFTPGGPPTAAQLAHQIETLAPWLCLCREYARLLIARRITQSLNTQSLNTQ